MWHQSPLSLSSFEHTFKKTVITSSLHSLDHFLLYEHLILSKIAFADSSSFIMNFLSMISSQLPLSSAGSGVRNSSSSSWKPRKIQGKKWVENFDNVFHKYKDTIAIFARTYQSLYHASGKIGFFSHFSCLPFRFLSKFLFLPDWCMFFLSFLLFSCVCLVGCHVF